MIFKGHFNYCHLESPLLILLIGYHGYIVDIPLSSSIVNFVNAVTKTSCKIPHVVFHTDCCQIAATIKDLI